MNNMVQPQGSNMGTGMPAQRARSFQNPNTAGPTPQGQLDNFNADNGAVGANAIANASTNSGTTFGDALTQLYQTENRDGRAYGAVVDPSHAGGMYPPGAPIVSGNRSLIGPSLGNSQGNAAADSIHRLDYLNSLPWNTPQGNGAAVNGPGPQMPQRLPRRPALNAQPQPPLNLSLTFPQSNLGGGLR